MRAHDCHDIKELRLLLELTDEELKAKLTNGDRFLNISLYMSPKDPDDELNLMDRFHA